MINRIIDFSVKNKPIIFMLVAVGCIWGWWSIKHVSLDAIPDLSDTQVIIFSRWDRSPDLLEAQVTYPIVTAMVGAPKVKAVRGFSDFGYSYVYVVFQDDTDIYWARSRTQEYLSTVLPRLPDGAKTEIGPDATPLGWVFQYALVDESGKNNLTDLRTYQDFYLKYYLRSVPGVAEGAAEARAHYDKALADPLGLLKDKIEERRAISGRTSVDLPGDKLLQRSGVVEAEPRRLRAGVP